MISTFARRWRLTVLLVLVLVSSMMLAACGSGLDENASGEEIYNARCSSCHRKDLSGGIGPPLGPDSEAANRPLDYYQITISSGKGRMPSFGSSLTEEQISRVIDYVISVQEAG
jgi:mono/diheme cytochrome c family protein